MTILQALKGIGGEYEVTRVAGAIGALAYIICANFFMWYETVYHGQPFDISAYCIAFPAGLGVAVGSIAGAAALKDRNVARSQVVSSQAAPAAPPAGQP